MSELAPLTEKQFQQWLMDLAGITNWLAYHTHDSRRSAAGFPDTVLVKSGRMIFAELKVGKRKATTEQTHWLMEACAVPGVESHVWYPHQRDEIEAILKGARHDGIQTG